MTTDSGSSTEPASNINDPFDAEKATNAEIRTFVKVWTTTAKEAEIWNNNLWYIFHKDFAKFTLANFKGLPKMTRMMLRTFLYTRGVYVSPYDTLQAIGDTLYECARREAPHKWTWEEIKTFEERLETAVSPWLAEQVGKLNHHPSLLYSPRQASPAAPSYAYPTSFDLTSRPKSPVLPSSTFISPLPSIPQSQNQANSETEEYYPQGSTNTASSTKSGNNTPSLDTFAKEWMAGFDDPSMDAVIDNSIWELFSENFVNFTEDEFTTLNPNRKQGLKNFLYKKGVYIQDYTKASNKTLGLGAALYECAQRQDPYEWTEEDLHRYSAIVGVPQSWLEDRTRILRYKSSLGHTSALSQNQSNLCGYSKEIGRLYKMYNEELKYDGHSTDQFDYRLIIFYHKCNVAGVPPEAYLSAFPEMLKGMALDHFFNYTATNAGNLTFSHACDDMRDFFEGPEYQRANLEKWHKTTLQGIISENPSKSTSECFHLLIHKLQKLQHGLMYEMRNVATLQDKVITSCRSVPACGWGTSGPMTSFGDLLCMIKSSIATYEQQYPVEPW